MQTLSQRIAPAAAAPEVCRDFAQSSKLEWLETNGTGAFAMGTVAGANTRRYHALLVASLRPPVERYVTLSRVEETLVGESGCLDLGAAHYPGIVTPRGFDYLERFTAEPCACWQFDARAANLEKQVYLVEGRQAVVLRYRAQKAVKLKVRPFLAFRDYHSLSHANTNLHPEISPCTEGFRMKPYASLPEICFRYTGKFQADANWYYQNEYPVEFERGLDFHEDLYTPGVMSLALHPGEWAQICVSVDGPVLSHTEPPSEKRDPFLVRRADGKQTIIAGYPWFTDWGRDTMISIPGLLIAKGRLREAREIIQGFLMHLNNGLIPNRFPDAGHLPEYNTADATLWMFEAVRAYVDAGGDFGFVRDIFYPVGKQILEWHRHGTSYWIQVDQMDGLLRAGIPGTQLTWMDAKIGDDVVTWRHGKPVEVNALWHNALRLMAEWGEHLDDSQAQWYAEEAERVRDSFAQQFWNEEKGYLYDVLQPEGPAEQLRPNQIFAVSLRYPLLAPEQQQAVVRVVERELLTPVGLRTLARSDPEYRPHYRGGVAERDGAYHQGTVWPWLIGPYIDAYLKAFGKTPDTLQYCSDLVRRLEEESAAHGCLGSIAEIYDGDEPRYPRGCPAQAWSVAEVARVKWLYGL